jgi:hypothetical protein
MLFEKEFIYLKRFKDDDPVCQNIRISSLFEKVNLMDRIIEENTINRHDIKPIDYQQVSKILHMFRTSSKQFLQEALCKL